MPVVKMFFRGAWAGLFAGPIVVTLVLTGLFFYGVSTSRNLSVPGMNLTHWASGDFQFIVDLRPIIAAAVVGALVAGLVVAWSGSSRLSTGAPDPRRAAPAAQADRETGR